MTVAGKGEIAVPRTRLNVAANLAGRLVQGVLSLLLIPVYVQLLGIEGYALVGIMTSIQLLANLFDFGMSASLGRELARGPSGGSYSRADLVRSLEIVYWSIGLVLGILLGVAAWLLPAEFLASRAVSLGVARETLLLGGAALVLQWPLSLYASGLWGLQRQGILNVVGSTAGLARGVVGIGVLLGLSRRPGVFLIAQAFVTFVQIIFLRREVVRATGRTGSGRFDVGLLRRIRAFAKSQMLASTGSLVLSQMDRLILLPILPLTQVGYYVVGGSLASAVVAIGSPIADAVSPRYARLHAEGRLGEAMALFDLASQGTALFVFPAAAVCGVFASEVCRLWSHDPRLIAGVGAVLGPLVLANCVYVFAVGGADQLQAAEGSFRTSVWARFVAIAAAAFLLPICAREGGVAAAALFWLALYGIMSLVVPLVVLHRWQAGFGWRWILASFMIPLAVSLATAIGTRTFLGALIFNAPPVVAIATALTVSVFAVFATSPELRRYAKDTAFPRLAGKARP